MSAETIDPGCATIEICLEFLHIPYFELCLTEFAKPSRDAAVVRAYHDCLRNAAVSSTCSAKCNRGKPDLGEANYAPCGECARDVCAAERAACFK